MKRVIWGLVALAVVSACLVEAADTGTAQTIKTETKIPVFSVTAPHKQRGFFPKGVELQVIRPAGKDMLCVRLNSSSGKVIEGLCKKADLGLGTEKPEPVSEASPATIVDRRVPGSYYSESEWLEDYEGHKQAVKMQTKYKVPMLIFFYADWNDDCEGLWKGLLSSRDFKRVSKNFIKLRINPEHGKKEGLLANRYKLRRYPTTLVIDRLHAKPRKIDLCYYSFGKFRTMKPPDAVAEVMGVREAEKAAAQEGQSGGEEEKKGGWNRW